MQRHLRIVRFQVVILALAVASVAACDSQPKPANDNDKAAAAKPEAAPPAEDKASGDDLDPSKPSSDWPTVALTKVEDEVDGIAFSIELPPAELLLPREVKKSDGTFPGYVTWNGRNPLMDPSFTVQIDSFPPADLEALARKIKTHPQPAEITRQEQLEDGGMLLSFIETSKQFVSVRVWRTSATTQKVVRVTLQVRDVGPIPNLDALRPWMEQVASSFTVE
ncbi:hypothetical protein [Enhygromyxa salina]|uniref:Lipoprotein n=1 Tax=Enhygromyxa salina TaxID=215803 RepID=A0A2S9YS03_9BACT|nr:hypothetical protein [Enhygromyxa salina]PRQ07867.1 hypothetical protein ENSA7_24320 [Enhygromyxa salina]